MRVVHPQSPSLAPSRRFQGLVGTVLGEYRIDRWLAEGGMGTVFEGWDLLSRRRVAVKVMDLRDADGDQLRVRFKREVHQLASMKHPHVTTLIDHGITGDIAFLVMEFVTGVKLSTHLAERGPLKVDEFAPVAAQILRAVGHAHRHRVMLRDIKPDNIMLCPVDGPVPFVKLIDFGLARFEDETDKVTTNRLIGTAAYLAPEQVRGERLDMRVDVYALGVLFYRMLSGVLPHDADNFAALLFRKVERDPCPLETVLPPGRDVPAPLMDLVHACLARDRAGRPRDADAVLQRLVEILPASSFRTPPAPHANTAVMFEDDDEAWQDDPTKVRRPGDLPWVPPRPAPSSRILDATGRPRWWAAALGAVAAGVVVGWSTLRARNLATLHDEGIEVLAEDPVADHPPSVGWFIPVVEAPERPPADDVSTPVAEPPLVGPVAPVTSSSDGSTRRLRRSVPEPRGVSAEAAVPERSVDAPSRSEDAPEPGDDLLPAASPIAAGRGSRNPFMGLEPSQLQESEPKPEPEAVEVGRDSDASLESTSPSGDVP